MSHSIWGEAMSSLASVFHGRCRRIRRYALGRRSNRRGALHESDRTVSVSKVPQFSFGIAHHTICPLTSWPDIQPTQVGKDSTAEKNP